MSPTTMARKASGAARGRPTRAPSGAAWASAESTIAKPSENRSRNAEGLRSLTEAASSSSISAPAPSSETLARPAITLVFSPRSPARCAATSCDVHVMRGTGRGPGGNRDSTSANCSPRSRSVSVCTAPAFVLSRTSTLQRTSTGCHQPYGRFRLLSTDRGWGSVGLEFVSE